VKIRVIAAGLLALLLLVSGSSLAGTQVGVVFSDDEVRIIASWYRDHGTGSMHHNQGRGKKPKGLPPGIAKNLGRGKALPPGIAKQQLPDGLLRLLPAPPRGYERVIIDGRVLLVEVATQVIHDVLADIILD
jgi:Ni/Co efflux regulator RcnB